MGRISLQAYGLALLTLAIPRERMRTGRGLYPLPVNISRLALAYLVTARSFVARRRKPELAFLTEFG